MNIRERFTMDRLVFLVLLVCSVARFYSCGGSATTNRGYVFMVPSRLLADETETGCLSLHNLEPPAHVLLELVSPSWLSEEEILSSTNAVVKTGVETCLELMVPSTKYSYARLRLKIKFDKHPNYVVESEQEVSIEHDSLLTFVETDKPVYKHSQDVNIRILMLTHDLKPWKKQIPKVWIENPSEVRVAQWTNVSLDTGMAQLLFPLSPEPSSGTWNVKVEKRSNPQLIHTTTFEVKKYVLPRFQLTINSPGYILADAENVTWNICAKYSYGKPVKGTLLLKSTPQTPSWKRNFNLPELHYEYKLDSPDGCTEFILSGASLGLAHWKMTPNNIVLIANFTEAGTGVVETAISRTVVKHQSLKLDFASYMPKYFKLGLPYHGKLRVLRHDDTPAPNEKIQLHLRVHGKDERIRSMSEYRNFTSSADGFIDFVLPPLHEDDISLHFIATGVVHPIKYYVPDKRWRVFMDQPSAYIYINRWYSPSNSYLTVARGNQPIVCGEKYSFNVMYTIPSNSKGNKTISFHYSINSKGDLLTYGHVTHKPNRDTVLDYSEFHHLLDPIESSSNKTNTVAHRFPLSVKVTPSMAPISELLLYYVRSDGEVVATTYTIEVGHCFENKVKSAWHTDAQTPGAVTQYHVEAAPWSLCGISAVDKSTLFLTGWKANLVDADQAFDQLKRFHEMPLTSPVRRLSDCILQKIVKKAEQIPMEEFDHLPKLPLLPWFIGRRKREAMARATNHVVDATQAFDDFNVIVMSDLVLVTRPCSQNFNMILEQVSFSRMQGEIDEPDMMKAMQPTAFALINYELSPKEMTADVGYFDQLSDRTANLRSYFPETWLWELVPTGKEGKVTIERVLPHTITDWVGYTTCISPIHGLGIAPPTTITAFQPFFLDYSLPYSVKRWEILRMKVSLFNYMQHSLPVMIKLESAPGLELHLSDPKDSFCVKPRDSVVHEFMLRPLVIGEVNITVSASIDHEYPESCGPETLIIGRDVIVKPILILPEGFPMDVTKSSFICPKDFSDDSMIVWDLMLPEDVVPDSGRAYVNLVGNILGPALENLNKLVKLPMGCGEQNMILLVPNIYVIRYLDAIGSENPALRATALKNMEKGYQRELNYRHPDGSYSAFGPNSHGDGSSIWLTAFVLKSFAQAQSLIHIDEHELRLSGKWIMKKQLENGCFPVLGRVFHKNMKGGLQEHDSSSSALTAYILIALLESGTLVPDSLIGNALYCLEKGMASNSDSPYTVILSTYAFALLGLMEANSSMMSVLDRATHHNNLLWWEDKTKPSLSLSIEMTAYAILTLVKLGSDENMIHALKAVRWISKQRNANGGFTSTQDTVLGLEALAKYAMAVNNNATDLSVLVTGGNVDYVYKLHKDNRMVLTQIRLPVLPTVVEIFAEGEGCVLVQSNIKYNVARATGSEAFELSVASHTTGSECAVQEITVCGRYKLADEESNMVVLEIGMISGYVPDRESLHTLLGATSSRVKRFEEDHDIVTIYFDNLTGRKTCISFTVVREYVVERLESANVKLYDYYQQELTISSNYSFPPICGSADPSEESPTPAVEPRVDILLKSITAVEKPLLQEENLKIDLPLEKSTKNTMIEKPDDKLNNRIVQAIEKPTFPAKPNLVNDPGDEAADKDEKPEDKVEGESITGVRLKSDNIQLEDYVDSVAHVPTTNDNSIVVDNTNGTLDDTENPSTVLAEETDDSVFPGNPSFTVVDHELETPEGVEGPLLVYVKPDTYDYKTQTTDTTLTPEMENQNVSQEDTDDRIKNATNSEAHVSSPTRVKQFCPVCIGKLPSDFGNIYCSARSAVKVAIRRFGKTRLLLDLQASREVRRLRATVEFTLNPSCHCTPFSAGNMALILNKDNDFLASGDHKQTLNNSFTVYALPLLSGVPREITELRDTCSNQMKNRSTYVDTPVGD
ncbi:murinoglobulin-1 [Ptiloglossa arizonensis]|uniref:murinoglobulin-1 n=1 Tax=Ptiloglossa arizonensis TaxID=3350558 RepID=UPI003FA1100F